MSSSEHSEFDPASRRLCPDGACTGLVDDSGRCGECRRSWDDVPVAALPVVDAAPDDDEPPYAPYGDPSGIAADAEGFGDGRTLCADGTCIGVIGADGRCSECGRSAEAS